MTRSSRIRPHEAYRPTRTLDTAPSAEAAQLQIYRTMSSERKIQLVFEAIDMSRSLAMTGIRDRYPQASDEEVLRRLWDLVLGEELASRVYGPLDDALR